LWDDTGRKCYHDDEMIPNAEFAAICDQYKRKPRQCRQVGCTWDSENSRGEKCVPNRDGTAPVLLESELEVSGKSGKSP
jgi:hypothetical protein